MRSLIVGRLCNIALDGVHLFCLQAGGNAVHLGLEMLNNLIVLDDGLVQGRYKLFQMR